MGAILSGCKLSSGRPRDAPFSSDRSSVSIVGPLDVSLTSVHLGPN